MLEKNNLTKQKIANFLRIIALLIIILFSFWSLPIDSAIDFLQEEIRLGLNSSLMVNNIKGIASSLSGSKISFLFGNLSKTDILLTKVSNYLELSNFLMVLQLLLLRISKSILFKLILVSCIPFLFFAKTKIFVTRLIIIVLLIAPGLSLYTLSIKFMTEETHIQINGHLNTTLKKIDTDYKSKNEKIKTRIDELKEKQLKKNERKHHKNKLNIFQKIEDGALKIGLKGENVIELGVKEFVAIMKIAEDKLIDLSINLVTKSILVFLLLPLLYFWSVKQLIVKFFFLNIENK